MTLRNNGSGGAPGEGLGPPGKSGGGFVLQASFSLTWLGSAGSDVDGGAVPRSATSGKVTGRYF